MKTLGEAALELPWIAPSVASLTTLARFPVSSVWSQLRTDPGIVLLSARSHKLPACELDVSLLDAALHHQQHFDVGFVDWNQPGHDLVYRACYRHALLASRLADKLACDVDQAWNAGFLAALGCLAVSAANPQAHPDELNQHVDGAAIARRLARSWRLPVWLTPIVGQLGLPASIVERLGADVKLFQIVQLAVLLIQDRESGLSLTVGATLPELLAALELPGQAAHALADEFVAANVPKQTWQSPAHQPLLAELLHMARDQRRQNDAAWIERLQQDLDHLQAALVAQCAEDQQRLHTMKLSSLAEFAAGAGHEINNPLAVISGQAQYVLKQMDWLDGPADEIENVGAYLDNLRATITPSLKKIVGQTQRIHGILTELMQFARPSTPKLQAVAVTKLMREVADSLQSLAAEHQVELSFTPTDDAWLYADPQQARIALAGMVKNAIEAAPAGGWARVRAVNERPGLLDLIVEDNGQGPPAAVQEHMFDPFYSGRSAGRGRGMGLPTAWRLARQLGGDVSFEGIEQGITRFVLTLPMTAAPSNGRVETCIPAPRASAGIAPSGR